MKRVFTSILIGLIMCVAIGLTGCSNEFAKQEYNDTEKITQINDRSAQSNFSFHSVNGSYSLTVSKFDGRETLWKKTLKEGAEVEMRLDLSVASGYAKIVYIDCDNNLTVLVEYSNDNSHEQTVTKTVSFTSGLNRLKIVGYDCKDVELKILFDEP